MKGIVEEDIMKDDQYLQFVDTVRDMFPDWKGKGTEGGKEASAGFVLWHDHNVIKER